MQTKKFSAEQQTASQGTRRGRVDNDVQGASQGEGGGLRRDREKFLSHEVPNRAEGRGSLQHGEASLQSGSRSTSSSASRWPLGCKETEGSVGL